MPRQSQIVKAAACAVFKSVFSSSPDFRRVNLAFDQFISLRFPCRVFSLAHEVVIAWSPSLSDEFFVRCMDVARGDEFCGCRERAVFAWAERIVRKNTSRFAFIGSKDLLVSVFPPDIVHLGEYGSRLCMDLPIPSSADEYRTPPPLMSKPNLSVLW